MRNRRKKRCSKSKKILHSNLLSQKKSTLAENGFAKDFVLENQAGQPTLKAMRRIGAEHQIEEVGAKLRAMMPWIAKNKLVDKAKN